MTDNTEQAKQTSKYDKYCTELCPKDKLTEWFIKFYGENRREQITQKINKIPVMFIPEDVFFEDLMIALKEKNPNMSFSERKQETQAIINALSNVVYDQPFDMQIISKHRDILKELDFRFLKHPETKKLLLGDTQSREILEARIEVPQNAPKDELKRSVIALDMFIRHYNKVAEMQNPQYTGITIDYVGSKNRVRYFCYEGNDKNVLYTQNPPTIPKFEKLSEEEIHFLEDFIDAKMGSGKHGDTYPIYLVNNINKLFGKNHQTLLEARNDPELQFFFDFFGDVSSCLDLMISAANSIPENFTPEKINNLSKDKIIEKYYNSACYFINEKGVNASCSCETNHINIPLRPNLNMPTVVHEMNHALANEPNNSLDFNSKSTGFNEVVNEYFTQEIIKQIPNNEKEQYNLDARRCGYTDGVDFMKDFLDTYKDILIDCQFGNANETLKNFIGESNFNQLMEYGNKLEKLNYLQMVCDVTTKNGKQISSIAELMKEYKQDPSIIKEALEDVNQKQILEILNMENFLTEMVLRHKEFAQGHITDINLEQISSLEHTTALTKTLDDEN